MALNDPRFPQGHIRQPLIATGAVFPEEELLQQLAETEDVWAKGAAWYGPGGVFDPMRKIKVSTAAVTIRDDAATRSEKYTDKVLDALAHVDVGYVRWVEDHLVSRAEWLALDAKRERWYMALRIIQARGFDAKRNGG